MAVHFQGEHRRDIRECGYEHQLSGAVARAGEGRNSQRIEEKARKAGRIGRSCEESGKSQKKRRKGRRNAGKDRQKLRGVRDEPKEEGKRQGDLRKDGEKIEKESDLGWVRLMWKHVKLRG